MSAEGFADSNVLLYVISGDTQKADIAEQVLRRGVTISVQVLNEFADVALRKLKLPLSEVRDELNTYRKVCDVRALDLGTHARGMALSERYGYGVYDAMIIASALEAGCTTLYSEDLQHGQRIGGLTIRNPFQG